MRIIQKPITDPISLLCPCCDRPVLVVHGDDCEVPCSGKWLQDGDTIPGLYQALSDAQKTPDDFEYGLLVGQCRECDGHYYVVYATLMEGRHDDVHEYLFFNVDVGPEQNFVCALEEPDEQFPARWLLHEYSTKAGPMRHYVFGPWRLEDPDEIIGPYGVCPCSGNAGALPWVHARILLLAAWDALRETPITAKES